MKYITLIGILSIGLVSAQFNTTICDPGLDTNNRCNCDSATRQCDCPEGTGDYYDFNCIVCPLEDFCLDCQNFDEKCSLYNDAKCTAIGVSKGTTYKTNQAGSFCYKCTDSKCLRCQSTQYCGQCMTGYVVNMETGKCVTKGTPTPTLDVVPSCPSTFCQQCNNVIINGIMQVRCSICSNYLKKTNIEGTQCFYCSESSCLHCDSDKICSQCRNGYTKNSSGGCTYTP